MIGTTFVTMSAHVVILSLSKDPELAQGRGLQTTARGVPPLDTSGSFDRLRMTTSFDRLRMTTSFDRLRMTQG